MAVAAAAVRYSESPGLRSFLISPRRFFDARRCSRAPAFGVVARRRFGRVGRTLKQRHEPCARRVAILRLRAMLAAVDEEHALRRHSLAGERQQALLDSVGSDEAATSKRSSTAVETLLTFCPPGPDALTKRSSSSASSSAIASVIRIIDLSA